MANSIIPDVCDLCPPSGVQRSIPDGACDCHFHVFDSPSKQVVERSYTAPDAEVAEYMCLRAVLGLTRGVLVQPSVYGLDNQTTLKAQLKFQTSKRCGDQPNDARFGNPAHDRRGCSGVSGEPVVPK